MRRVHTPTLKSGRLELDATQAHHLRDVLRLKSGDEVELFDDAGNVGRAVVISADLSAVRLDVRDVRAPGRNNRLTIASAIPKGERADWMIEKLSELGVFQFIPLITQRSVVHPEGKNKFERWRRLATESAKQSHRSGIMRIEAMTQLTDLVSAARSPRAIYLTPDAGDSLLAHLKSQISDCLLLIGPEGGWTQVEVDLFATRQIKPAHLTDSILRIETAAVAAAAIAACLLAAASNPPSNP